MNKNPVPKLGGVTFCNATSKGETGKIDCRGVFTTFLAWAYPTSQRSWHAVVAMYDLPIGTTTMTAAISFNSGKKTTLAKADIEHNKESIGVLIDLPLSFAFKNDGYYTVHFNIVGTKIKLDLPIKVATQPWPKFSKKQLEFLKNTPSIPHSIQMTVSCSKCSNPHLFEDPILPDVEIAKGAIKFPESGTYECDKCGQILHLRDIQGQARSSIIAAVTNVMKRGR